MTSGLASCICLFGICSSPRQMTLIYFLIFCFLDGLVFGGLQEVWYLEASGRDCPPSGDKILIYISRTDLSQANQQSWSIAPTTSLSIDTAHTNPYFHCLIIPVPGTRQLETLYSSKPIDSLNQTIFLPLFKHLHVGLSIFTVAREIFCCGMQALRCGMRDLVSRPGIEPRPLS